MSFCKRRFDGQALFAAMDAQRSDRGLSWQAVARQTGVAASTLQRTQVSGPMETDGVLAMARWIGRPLEDFIAGAEQMARTHREVAQYRFNCKALYAALDEQRRARGMSWSGVAAEMGGLSPAMLTRLAKGGRIGAHVMVPAVGWLGRTVASFCTDPTVTGMSDARKAAKARIPSLPIGP